MIREEVKSMRKKNIDSKLQMKKEILANFELRSQVHSEVMGFFTENGIDSPHCFFKEC
jgi:hypothetical protein